MSVYSSSTGWPASCSVPNQSPINLSQSSSKPCDLMCELVMDDAMIPQANVVVSDEGLILDNEAGLGSCKFSTFSHSKVLTLQAIGNRRNHLASLRGHLEKS